MVRSLCLFALSALCVRVGAQIATSSPTYSMSVAVDEVTLTFSAADTHGLPINDLQLGELSLLDDASPPRRIVTFRVLKDLPIRAGILMDTSQSMEETRAQDRGIAIRYAQQILRQQTDKAFVMGFDRLSQVVQPWTSNVDALSLGIRNRRIASAPVPHLPGTAVVDAVYRACLNQFKPIENGSSGNFILLFSDGEDNASLISVQQAVDMCQRAHTAVYAFHPPSKAGFGSGSEALGELARQSGGRIFRDDESQASIDDDLRTIEADLRNQYLLVYQPVRMKRDGSFHRIVLKVPQRVERVNIRSGYYAPTR